MNLFKSFDLKAQNLTNGFLGKYEISFESTIQINSTDIVIVEFPSTINLPGSVKCSTTGNSTKSGIEEVFCSKVGNAVYASLKKVTREFGVFEFFIDGIKNPETFINSGPFTNIHMTDYETYQI